MLGFHSEDLNSSLLDVLHPEDRDAVVRQYVENLSRTAGMSVTKFRIVRPDTGETRWIASRGRALVDGDGQPVGRLGTFEDYTDRKLTSDALRSTLRRYQALLKATSVIVWHSDASQQEQ